jgi:hypothetical protein
VTRGTAGGIVLGVCVAAPLVMLLVDQLAPDADGWLLLVAAVAAGVGAVAAARRHAQRSPEGDDDQL